VTTTFITRNGQHVVLEGNVNCRFINGEPAYTRAIFRDISRLKETERTLKRSYEREKKLRESLEDELTRRVEFNRVLVHELRTPLTSIMGFTELLEDSNLKPPYDRAVKGMARSCNELNQRIGELLELTRSELGGLAIQPRRISPITLIRDVVKESRSLLEGDNITLITDIPPALPYIKADRKRLRQVLQNLINNASKAILEEGKITLRAGSTDDSVIISVTDTGLGIRREDQAHIFEPYYRASGVAGGYEGFGLGLTLSKRIVELHGGQIRLESKPGKGSTFSFSVPVYRK
jgi:signal transduction histidine kinase